MARVNFSLSEASVERWWPNGYGDQRLYDLQLTFGPRGHQEQTSKAIRVAFRFVRSQFGAIEQNLPH